MYLDLVLQIRHPFFVESFGTIHASQVITPSTSTDLLKGTT
jgi:hypothetical protein